MQSTLEHGDVSVENVETEQVLELVAAATPFWLDIVDPTDAIIDQIAGALDLHPLAVEDSKEFDQRGKLVVYGNVVMAIGFGLDQTTGEPIEVHGYLTESFLITFRRAPSATIDRLHSSGSLRQLLGDEPIRVLHHLTTELHDDFVPYIDQLEDRLGLVEKEMLGGPRDDQLAEVSSIPGPRPRSPIAPAGLAARQHRRGGLRQRHRRRAPTDAPGSCPHQMAPVVAARIVAMRWSIRGGGRSRSAIGSPGKVSIRCRGGRRSFGVWSVTG